MTSEDSRQVLASLFARTAVAELAEIKRTLGTTSRTTVFRALSAVGYYASYNHAGRYYTLEGIPQFNEDGIWAWGDALFSRLRTLRATLVSMVTEARAGCMHGELETRVRLRVHDALRGLVAEGKISRVEHNGLYLYVSPSRSVGDSQVAERRRMLPHDEMPAPLPPAAAVIEVLLAVIRHPEDEPAQTGARVRRHGITQVQVDQVFAHFQVGGGKRGSGRSRR